MKKLIHRGIRVFSCVGLTIVLLLLMILPGAGVWAAETYLDVTGTYTMTSTVRAAYLSGATHPVYPKGTLVITTQTDQTISVASLVQMNETIALTGMVGSGAHPYITLTGTDSLGTTVTINARVSISGDDVTGFSGDIDGYCISDGNNVAEGTGGDLSAYTTVKANSGTYASLLTAGSGAGSVGIRFLNPTTRLKLKDMENLTTGKLGFYYYLSAAPGPQLELRFTGPNGIGHVDVTIMPAQGANAHTGEWYNQTITSASTRCEYYGNDDVDATAFSWEEEAGNYTLAEILDLIDAETAMGDTSAANWTLTRVGVELWEAGSRTCYVDDVRIGSYTYTLEPTRIRGKFSARINPT